MKNAEEAIGKVLAGLRDAEASPDMERHVLAAIEARASQRTYTKSQWAWSVALASMIAASLFFAIVALHRHGQPPTKAQRSALPTEAVVDSQQALLQPHELIASAITPVRAAIYQRKTPPVSVYESMLLRDMRAPSHPAPVAPLTEEEKLLLRAIHTGDPQVIAMLNPEIRAQQEAKSVAEFQKFVE